MLSVTKITHFEMAHAIHGYSGACRNIHGHSYELHVTVSASSGNDEFIPPPGFVIDFKEIKKQVNKCVVEKFDHKLLLSNNFLSANPGIISQENLVVWDIEPTAENLLLFIRNELMNALPAQIQLVRLKLYETKDSFAEWEP